MGPNEIQSITTSATDINAVQTVGVFATAVPEVQKVTISNSQSGYFFLELNTNNTGGSDQYSGYIYQNYPANNNGGATYGKDVASILSSMPNVSPFGAVTVSKQTIDSNNFAFLITFPLSMGNVPQMSVHYAALQPTGTAQAVMSTVTDGNVVGGSFRLTFDQQTTADIPSDATADQVRESLEALPNIGSVDVTRTGPDNQLAFKWTIVFNSPMNSGAVSTLVPDYTKLTKSSASGTVTMNVSSVAGNELSGTFTLTFARGLLSGSSVAIPFDASAAVFQTALTSMPNNVIPPGSVAVSRSGPDGQKGYTWSVTFLSDFYRTFYGPQKLFTFDKTSLLGSGAAINVKKVRVGTIQEVQKISVRKSTTGAINSTMAMQLTFSGQTTIPIHIRPSFNTCDSNIVEVQTITSSTVDNTQFGGIKEVNMYTQFRLIYGNEITGWIDANPTGSTDCSQSALQIQNGLEEMDFFHTVSVTGQSLSNAQDCRWTVSFLSSIGDLRQLQVQSRNQISGAIGNIAYTSTAGPDTITTATVANGQKDAITAALELLNNVGTVTVTAVNSTQSVKGECTWLVTFDSNAGNLPLMQAQLYAAPNSATRSSLGSSVTLNGVTATISEVTAGTSTVIAGNFALSFRGDRTVYVPYDADARTVQNILEDLTTIGAVDVTRSAADENNGYTWFVTFLTNLGSLDLIQFDNSDMTGTVVSGTVRKEVVGVTPPFNSLDPTSQLPLGSVVITDLSNLAATVEGLDQGIAYYFRVAALNSVGQGPYAFSSIPFAIPQPQRPGNPLNVTLNPVDGSSLQVTFSPPNLDGGQAITFYKVEYANSAFASEVQQVTAACDVVNEVQVVNITTAHNVPSVQLIYVSTTYQGTSQPEIQLVTCDAIGGTFRLTFNGLTTAGIPYNANTSAIEHALEQLQNIDSVNVSFTTGVSTACFQRNVNLPTSSGFLVTFRGTQGINGNLPLMTGYTNNLQGARYLSVTQTQAGDAPISGTVRLSFRGDITQPISLAVTNNNQAAIAGNIRAALIQLSTIPANGVTVTYEALSNTYAQLWRVTFSSAELGGDVEALEVVSYYNELLGSNVAISIASDGLETAAERGYSPNPSVAGNQVSGQFTLTYRGHTTALIDFNAAETDMKAKLEALPNIDLVEVNRVGPTVYKEYSWAITFHQISGSFPPGTGNFVTLVPTFAGTLGGKNSTVNVAVAQQGSVSLGGTFSLTLTDNGVTETASNIPADASASELAGYLNALTNVGTVSVSRLTLVNGYQWLVTFDGCKIVNGTDICNSGDVQLLIPDNSLMQCAVAPVSVLAVVNGSGPGENCPGNQDGLCANYVNDLTTTPLSMILKGLTPGSPYYAQVAAHNR